MFDLRPVWDLLVDSLEPCPPRPSLAGPSSPLWAALTGWACGPSSGPWVGERDSVREEVLIPGRWGALGDRQVIVWA